MVNSISSIHQLLNDLPNLLAQVTKIRNYTAELLKIRNAMWEHKGEAFYKVPDWLKRLLTYGIKDVGRYEKQSLASITKYVFGLYVDPETYLIYARQGLPPDIPVEYYKFSIAGNLEVLHKLAELAINIAKQKDIKIPEVKNGVLTANEAINDPNKLVALISGFLNACKNIAVGENRIMSLIFGLRKLTRRYAFLKYPELKNQNLFTKLSNILGLDVIFVPELADEEKRFEFTVIGYPDYAFDYIIDYHGRDKRREVHVIGVAYPRLCAPHAPSCYIPIGDTVYCGLRYQVSAVYAVHYGFGYRCVCVDQTKSLGAALCKINDAIWGIFDILGETLGIQNIGKIYAEKCRGQITEIPSWLRVTFDFRINKGVIEIYVSDYKGGVYISRTGLLEFLIYAMPLVHLGLCELVLKKDRGLLSWRWVL